MRSFPQATTVEAFLEASLHAGTVLASNEVRVAWTDPSAVEMMTVGDICGHLFLIVRRVGKRLEIAREVGGRAPEAGPPNWTGARIQQAADLDLPEHRQVRVDGAHVAAWGWEEVHNAYDARIGYVGGLLQLGLPASTDLGGDAVPFSAYLATRVVELTVHADDLACSLGVVSAPPSLALTMAVDALIDGSRSLHGDLAVLRALSRRERALGGIGVF